MPAKDQKMHSEAATIEVGRRVSVWLRREYPRDAAKLAARDFGCSPHTTKRWVNGALPENRHLIQMMQRWGKRFVAFVVEPAAGPMSDFLLDEELRELRQRLARLEDDLIGSVDTPQAGRSDRAASPAPSYPDGPVARPDRRSLEEAASPPAGAAR